jgi:hypothetical protein
VVRHRIANPPARVRSSLPAPILRHTCRWCGGAGGKWIWVGSWWSGGESWRVCGSCQGSGIEGVSPKQLAEILKSYETAIQESERC